MSQQLNEHEGENFGESQNEYGGRARGVPLRMRQLRIEAQIQLAEAQKSLARATVRSARYMLWATVACAASSVITVVAVLYGVFSVLSRLAH